MKALGQPLYVPPEGQLVQDIEKAWDELEKAEHRREVVLREELLRQEKLENLAYRFERKVCYNIYSRKEFLFNIFFLRN